MFTFADLAPPSVVKDWKEALGKAGAGDAAVPCFFVDAKRGGGDELRGVRAALVDAGKGVNERRKAKGIRPRAARVAVIGYPNVGKSALINKLAGRKAAKSENKAGVTRSLNWVRSPRARVSSLASRKKGIPPHTSLSA